MEIIRIPTINGSIIDPLESNFREIISDEFHDHLTMGGGPKCLGSSKICHGLILQGGDGDSWLRNRYFGYLLSFNFFRDRLWLRL
jgi:hypothetical protein